MIIRGKANTTIELPPGHLGDTLLIQNCHNVVINSNDSFLQASARNKGGIVTVDSDCEDVHIQDLGVHCDPSPNSYHQAFRMASSGSLRGCKAYNADIGVLVLHTGVMVSECEIFDVYQDHIRVMSSYVDVIGCVCDGHMNSAKTEHKDCIQVVGTNHGAAKDEYVETPIVEVNLRRNLCRSSHKDAQGIMVSDGVLISSVIQANTVYVPTPHGITINRAQGCTIRGNDLGSSEIRIGSRKDVDSYNADVDVYENTAGGLVVFGEHRQIVEYDNSFSNGVLHY
jgi:hypothetical protein